METGEGTMPQAGGGAQVNMIQLLAEATVSDATVSEATVSDKTVLKATVLNTKEYVLSCNLNPANLHQQMISRIFPGKIMCRIMLLQKKTFS